MTLRRYLRKSGFRYRINYPAFGKPDIVLPKRRIAIFIHGCFWHRHGCRNSVIPKTNTSFWKQKLDKNILRDKEVSARLKTDKWITKIIWECELENNFNNTVRRLTDFLNKTKALCSSGKSMEKLKSINLKKISPD